MVQPKSLGCLYLWNYLVFLAINQSAPNTVHYYLLFYLLYLIINLGNIR